MFNFLKLSLPNNIFLAPMAGVTDLAFRLMCRKWGAGLVFSEMVSAKALHYNDKKTMKLLDTDPAEAPLAVQIFGSEPDIMAESAKKLCDMGVGLLDINFGCPAPKITSNGEGSALLKDFKKIGDIVAAVSSAVDVPVMCKIRAGYEDFIPLAPLAHIIEDSGGAAITVHGRTRKMFYSGHSDWSKIAEVKEAVSIPVIGNGDVTDFDSASRMFKETGCDAVMIGRGAQGNPFIFNEINEGFAFGEPKLKLSSADRLKFMREHIELLVSLKGERVAVREARKHIAWYTKGMRGGAGMRSSIFKCESYEGMMSLIDEYIDSISDIIYIKDEEDSK